MRTITKQELVEANRKAYLEDRLVAQHFDLIEGDPCRYVWPTLKGGTPTGCAIGVALNDDERGEIMLLGVNTRCTVDTLSHEYEIVGFEDERFACELQLAHDDWALGSDAEVERYLQLIGL